MKEMEKNVMCVLLQTLRDKDLITQDMQDKAREKIFDTLDGPDFFCRCAGKEGEEADGHTHNSL